MRKVRKKEKPQPKVVEASHTENKKRKIDQLDQAKKEEKNETQPKKQKVEAQKEGSKTSEEHQNVVLKGNLIYRDIKVGNGDVAKVGKKLTVEYVGRLTDSKKQFDASKNFQFNLGRREVITGWDEGMKGMKVGGVRKLIIPPKMGYGNEAMGGIPKNSSLTFEVKLLKVT